MKNLIPMVLILIVAGLLLNVAAFAATTGNITATVMAQNISVAVTDGSISYGVLEFGATSSTILLADQQTATNNGNITEDLNIKGQNSAAWTLAGSAGSEQYVHEFSTSTFPGIALTTNYQTLAADVSSSSAQTFDLQITAPSSSADFTQQSVDVMVQAVAG